MEGGQPGPGASSPQSDSAEVLLHGVFALLGPAPARSYALSLTRSRELRMQRVGPAPAGPGAALKLADCIGCSAFAGREPPPGPAAYFSVFCYPFRKGWWDASPARQRLARTFRVCVAQEAEENLKLAETWAGKIRELAAPGVPRQDGVTWGLLPRPCHVLVLLNPQSGTGCGLQLFRSLVEPMLAEADVAFTLFVTGKAGPSCLQGLCRERQPGQFPAARGFVRPCRPRCQQLRVSLPRAAESRPRAGAGWRLIPVGHCGCPGGGWLAVRGGERPDGASGLAGRYQEASLHPARGLWERPGRFHQPLCRQHAGLQGGAADQLHLFPLQRPVCPHGPGLPEHGLWQAPLLLPQLRLGLHLRRGHRQREVPATGRRPLHRGHHPAAGRAEGLQGPPLLPARGDVVLCLLSPWQPFRAEEPPRAMQQRSPPPHPPSACSRGVLARGPSPGPLRPASPKALDRCARGGVYLHFCHLPVAPGR
ncbi:sphingosine kinase 1 isoform 2-T2 [Macrochelys suwanniensis]